MLFYEPKSPAIDASPHGAAATTVNAGGMQVHACWRTNTAAAPVSLGSGIYRHGGDCKCKTI